MESLRSGNSWEAVFARSAINLGRDCLETHGKTKKRSLIHLVRPWIDLEKTTAPVRHEEPQETMATMIPEHKAL